MKLANDRFDSQPACSSRISRTEELKRGKDVFYWISSQIKHLDVAHHLSCINSVCTLVRDIQFSVLVIIGLHGSPLDILFVLDRSLDARHGPKLYQSTSCLLIRSAALIILMQYFA